MRVNSNEAITLSIGGADVTVKAELLAELWIKKVMADSASSSSAIAALKPPKLKEGEVYIGAIVSADGSKRHHLILLPGDNADASWQTQMEWAASIGGELPDRVEGALLFATLRDQFRTEAYWTREQHAAHSHYAWYQSFGYGHQNDNGTSGKLRARAVRREPIE